MYRCGDQLSDLKTQGYANSAFAQMIMHYDKLFFDEPVSTMYSAFYFKMCYCLYLHEWEHE